ncbi:MAG: histone deacetylase [Dissulfuribacterales bacterium]
MPDFKTITIVNSPFYMKHDTGAEHPESPERMTAVMNRLLRNDPEVRMVKLPVELLSPRIAAREDVVALHKENYLMRFEEACLAGKEWLGHSDNRISYDSYEAAFLSAGAGLSAIDFLEDGSKNPIFCCVRPPGHHAEAALALGFCFLNNVAIAARYWQRRYGRKKIFILDFDAHHGNGIQELFDEDPDVFYVSIHEHPTFSFPGTGWANENGTGAGQGFTLNIPLSPGAKDEAVLKAMEEQVKPAFDAFQPDAMVVAAGFDGHALDDMSGLAYSTKLYGKLGSYLSVWAENCDNRLVSILEGGYHLEALAAGVEAYLIGLAIRV